MEYCDRVCEFKRSDICALPPQLIQVRVVPPEMVGLQPKSRREAFWQALGFIGVAFSGRLVPLNPAEPIEEITYYQPEPTQEVYNCIFNQLTPEINI